MPITLQELKHFTQLVDDKVDGGPVGTRLFQMGHTEKDVDPVKDIKEIRSGD